MKKASISILVLTALMAAPAFTAQIILTPVTLEPGCATVFASDGFVSEGTSLFSILGLLIPGLSYTTADLENLDQGDGIPDSFQLALLGAAICEGNTAIEAQFNHNKDVLSNNLLTPLSSAATLLPGMITNAQKLATDLHNWAHPAPPATPPAPTEVTAADNVVTLLNSVLTEIDSVLPSEYLTLIPIFVPVINSDVNFLAGLLGLDSDMGLSFLQLIPIGVGSQVSTVTSTIRDQVIPQLNALLAFQNLSSSLPQEITTLVGQLGTAADLIDTFTGFLANPDIEIYGTPNYTGTEPFSAAGDYNGDRVSNLQVYKDLVAAQAATPENFVAAASGTMVAWPGRNEIDKLPATSLAGLALLTVLLGRRGARSIRKKW